METITTTRFPGIFLQRKEMGSCKDFQVFGERGSGTNFLEQLIQRNLKIRRKNQYGWKHGFPVAIGYSPQSMIAGIYRDPVDWLLSLFHAPRTTYAVEVPKDFSAFIRQPFAGVTSHNNDEYWRTGTNATIPDDCPPQHLQLDRHPITGLLPETPMELRNLKLAALRGFRNRAENVVLVQYEQLKRDRRTVIATLANFYGIEEKKKFTPLSEPVQPPNLYKGRPRTGREAISPKDMDFILDRLDLDQERSVGYDISR